MTTLIDLMRQPSITALAWALIHFLWQGALFGAAAFAILRATRTHRASTRYLIGVTTLAAMMLTFVATFVILARQQPSALPELRAPAASVAAMEPVTTALPSPMQTIPSRSRRSLGEGGQFHLIDPAMLSLIVVAWTIGVFAMSIRLFGGWVLTRRLATRAASAVSPAIDAAARTVAAKLQIRRAVAILESPAVSVPTLVGWLKPVV